MRYIVKGAEPRELRKWKADNAPSPQNLQYGNLPGEVNKSIRNALLKEQGYLCAYTLRRLPSAADCHIEHVQPQNAAPELELDYTNMAACFPVDGGDKSWGYGAPIKGGKAVAPNVNFVSPHQIGCEGRFVFEGNGSVVAREDDTAAIRTLEILQLDHEKLVEMRRRAIESHGLAIQRGTTRRATKLKSAAEAQRFAREVLTPDANGRFEPFCVVLAQVAMEFSKREEARSQRMRAQHGGAQS